MVPYVVGDLLHLRVKSVGARLPAAGVGQYIPVQGHQQPQHTGVRQHPGGKAAVSLRRLQLLEVPPVAQPVLPPGAVQVEAPPGRQVEAGSKVRLRRAVPGQEFPPDPQHHPVVGLRAVDHRQVDQVPADQQHVHGPQEVPLALDGVGGPPPEQEYQFVKLMVVVAQLQSPGVLGVKEAVVLVQVPPLPDLAPVQHRRLPHFLHGMINCFQSTMFFLPRQPTFL